MTATLESPLSYRTRSGKWKFVLSHDLRVRLGIGALGNHFFCDEGDPIARLSGDLLTIYRGYAIDGCSPAVSLFGVRIGTPSPRSSLAGAFTHDCLYQFGELSCAPWRYDQADRIFLDLLRLDGFPLAGLYYQAVRRFGASFRRLTPPRMGITCLANHNPPKP